MIVQASLRDDKGCCWTNWPIRSPSNANNLSRENGNTRSRHGWIVTARRATL